MPSAIIMKLIGLGALVALVGGIILTQHLKINTQARTIAELRLAQMLDRNINKDQKETIDRLTLDHEDAVKRAVTAELTLEKTKAQITSTTEEAVKRITEHATPSDNQLVTPALRDALGSLRRDPSTAHPRGPAH